MRLTILAIGKLKAGPETALFERYRVRGEKIAPGLGLSGPMLREWSESRGPSSARRKAEEAERIIGALRPGGRLVTLDEAGRDIASADLAALIGRYRDEGIGEFAFAIGGPDGHGETLLQRADLKLRFGRATWPHQFVRVMLAEQLYRAMTIMTGHPYHRN